MSAPTTTQSVGLDFTEFGARHSFTQRREFKRWARSTPEGSHRLRDTARSIVVIIVAGFALALVTLFSLILVVTMLPIAQGVVMWIILIVVAAFVALAYIRLIDIWRRDVRFGPNWRRWMRLDRFALANRLIYVPEIRNPKYEGSVFAIGQARRAFDVVATTSGRYVEIGNYQFRGEAGIDRSLNQCGYVRIEADRRLPHLYLRSRAKGALGGKIGATFARHQEFALEGNFGDYFRLYAPGGYERDALYIFTPDLMVALIDHAAGYDVEFVDDHIYFYSRRRFNMKSPRTYTEILALVDSVANRALKQTRAYSDFRSADNVVAPQGSRLVPGLTLGAIVGVLILVGQVLHLTHVF